MLKVVVVILAMCFKGDIAFVISELKPKSMAKGCSTIIAPASTFFLNACAMLRWRSTLLSPSP